MTSIAPGWLSIVGAAQYTGFSTRSIHSAISNGKIKTYPVRITGNGKPVPRIKREDLDNWITDQTANENV